MNWKYLAFGILAGAIGGLVIVGFLVLAVWAYLPNRGSDPLYKKGINFIEESIAIARCAVWEEIKFLKLQRPERSNLNGGLIS